MEGRAFASLAVLLTLSLISPEFLPLVYISDDKVFLLWYPILAGLVTAIFEEFGWTGFAVATMLRQHHSVLRTGLSVGLLFGAWHFLVIFWSSGAAPGAGALSQAVFLPVVLFTWLPTYRVLMVWVYDRTRSLLVATLMYASLISFWTSLTPQVVLTGMPLMIFYIVLTAALWVVIAFVLRRQSPSQSGREVLAAGISNQKGASS